MKDEVTNLEHRKMMAVEGIEKMTEKIKKLEDSVNELEKGGENFLEKLQGQLKELESEADQLHKREAGPNDPEFARQQVSILDQ